MTPGISIDPATAAWINVAFLVLTGAAAGSVHFAGLSDYWVGVVRAWASDGAFFLTCVNLVFHLYSSPGPGPMVAPPDPPAPAGRP